MAYVAASSRLWLEPLSLKRHLEDFHELWTDPDAVKWSTRVPKTSIAESAEWLPTITQNADQPDIDKYALLLRPVPENLDTLFGLEIENLKGNPKCIGIVGTNRWSEQGMETGYCLNKAYWGRGFATEGFKLFLSLYWTLPGREHINNLVAKVHPENLQSMKVLTKCGGREGETLKGVLLSNGGEARSDQRCWYFERPGSVGNGDEDKVGESKKGERSEENIGGRSEGKGSA